MELISILSSPINSKLTLTMKKLFVTIALALTLSGCSLFPSNWGKEEGFVWCNARYLDLTSPAYQIPNTVNPTKDKRFKLAYDGYLYAVLGAIELQKSGKSEDKHFNLPSYVERYSSVDKNGFQATAFKVFKSSEKLELKEIVVAFRGTDEIKDWKGHNLSPTPKQYKPAQKFLIDTANDFKGEKLVVTGYSLGGGLAMNVLRSVNTSNYITEAWAFNSSPRTGESIKIDSRLHLISVYGEILDPTRKALRKGPKSLGALDENFSDGYNLIDASSFYLHSRWVLARQMLIFADMVYFEEAGRPENYISPPLAILKMAEEPKGCSGKYRAFLESNGRL